MKKSSIYVFIILFMASCGAQNNNSTANTDGRNYQALATEKLGGDVIYSLNEDKSYVLCVSDVKGTVQQPRNVLSYMVIKLNDNSTTLADKIEGGSVQWVSNTELEVFRTPGIMRDDQTRDDYSTIYNIETGKSYPKKNTEQH